MIYFIRVLIVHNTQWEMVNDVVGLLLCQRHVQVLLQQWCYTSTVITKITTLYPSSKLPLFYMYEYTHIYTSRTCYTWSVKILFEKVKWLILQIRVISVTSKILKFWYQGVVFKSCVLKIFLNLLTDSDWQRLVFST